MEDDFGLWEIVVSMFWLMLLFAWIWLLIAILSDIFRDRDLSGLAKAGWTLLLIVVPWLGAVLYLIVRGSSMNERNERAAADNAARMRAYLPDAAATTSIAEELRKLADMRDHGLISAADYELAKAKVLAI